MKAAAGFIDVTPQHPCPMAGFTSRPDVFTSVADALELNAIRLAENGQNLVILSIDSLSFGQELEGHCRSLAPAGTHVIGLASHTHFAPALDAHLAGLGNVDSQYRAYVFTQAEKLMRNLFTQELQDVRILSGSAQAHHAINRRRVAFRPVRNFPFLKRMLCLLPNRNGRKDETLQALRIETSSGDPLAVLWSYACHPVCFYDEYKVSADYPGAVRNTIRNAVKPGIPCLFLPGFAGNIRPDVIAPLNHPKTILRALLQGRIFGSFNKNTWQHWSASLADVALKALQSAKSVVTDKISIHDKIIPYTVLQDIDLDRPAPHYTRIDLGGLTFQILSGEPVQEIKDILPGSDFYIGYRGHMFGYLPTSHLLEEGGYEANGFRDAFRLSGKYHDDLDKRLISALY